MLLIDHTMFALGVHIQSHLQLDHYDARHATPERLKLNFYLITVFGQE